jgi:hypothetical protein
MVARVPTPSAAARRASARLALALALPALLALLAACGASSQASGEAPRRSCPATVVDTLSRVLARVYREGVFSERTASARHMIAASLPLRKAVEESNPTATAAAARELIATGHMTNLRIVRGTSTLADLGGPALTPLHGAILDARNRPIAGYVTSVWSDAGFLAEGDGIAEGLVALRAGARSVGGSLELPAGSLAREGTLAIKGVSYQYTSFPGQAFPAGALSIYLVKPVSATRALCGKTSEDTTVNTLSRVAHLIYAAEGGRRTHAQVARVQHDPALLRAVAAGDRRSTHAASEALLHHHLVRLRVSAADGTLLDDNGGPFVLAPVRAPLRLGARRIGSIVVSIQDDEGYKRLVDRLVGLKVLMYMDPARLVKNSLGPSPGTVPAEGSYSYRGHSYRVFTVDAEAFPSGRLAIRVLVPIPYR